MLYEKYAAHTKSLHISRKALTEWYDGYHTATGEHLYDDLGLMVSGEHVETRIQEYATTAAELKTRDQIYSAIVIYGLLTYENGEVFIPNRELMEKFEQILFSKESLGYVYRLAKHGINTK